MPTHPAPLPTLQAVIPFLGSSQPLHSTELTSTAPTCWAIVWVSLSSPPNLHIQMIRMHIYAQTHMHTQ